MNKFFSFFPIPESLDVNPVAISISDKKIRIISKNKGLEGEYIKFFDEKDLKDGVVEEGVMLDPEFIKEIILKWQKKYDFKYAYVSIPEQKTYLYRTSIDKAVVDTRSAIELTIEENVPINPKESVFDFLEIEEDIDNNKKEFLVCVAHEKVINAFLSVFQGLDLHIARVEMEAFPLVRIYDNDNKNCSLIMHIEEDKVLMIISYRGLPLFTQTINKSKAHKGICDEFCEELEKVAYYWEEHNDFKDRKLSKIENIILSGGETYDADLFNMIKKKFLNTKTVFGDIWLHFPYYSKNTKIINNNKTSSFSVSLGLLLDKNININLLKVEKQKSLYNEYKTRVIVAILFALSMFALSSILALIPAFIDINSNIKIETEREFKLKNSSQNKENEEIIKELETTNFLLRNIAKEIRPTGEILKIVNLKTQGIKINTVNYTNNSNSIEVSIAGIAKTRGDLIKFNKSIKNSNLFSDVDIPINDLTKSKDISFRFNLKIK